MEQLNDNSIKSYLLFLKYALLHFNTFNALFQSRKILIHKLFDSSQQLIRQIALAFIIPEALLNIATLNAADEKNIKHVTDIYVGPDCENFLATQSLEFAQQIKLKCLEFYKTAFKEMVKLLPYKNNFVEQLKFLEPKIALYDNARIIIKDLTNVASCVENIDITQLAFEWRILPTIFSNLEKEELARLEIDQMWNKILESVDFNGEKMFPNLELLIEVIFFFSSFQCRSRKNIFNSNGCKK